MDNDDTQVGQLLGRREVLTLLGGVGVGLLIGCTSDDDNDTPATGTAMVTNTRVATTSTATASTAQAPATPTQAVALPSCIVHPALTEGPYFVDEKLDRSDIRMEPADGSVKAGTPLTLVFNVSSITANACTALVDAMVDVWQCDALGVYSDARDPGFNTVGQQFLRGYQRTDADGRAQFTTIYPGWYQGRTVHIHFKIRAAESGGKTYEFTSQLFFNDTLTDVVHAQTPYSQKGQRTLRNAGDGIYQQSGGQLLLDARQDGAGYGAIFDIGVQLS